MATLKERLEIFKDVRAAKRRFGRGYTRQISDFKRMKSESSTLGSTDYYMFRLYEPEVWEREGGPRRFSGWRNHQALNFALNPRENCLPAWDKLTFEALAQSAGIPMPRLQAVYLPDELISPAIEIPLLLRSLDDLRAYLTNDAELPVFAKPSYCQKALLAARIEAYNEATDEVRLTEHGSVPLDRFFADYVTSAAVPEFYRPEYGYIFQSALRPHADITRLTGNGTLSGCRIVVAKPKEGPEVIAAVQKLAKPGRARDNFRGGRLGNLLVSADPESGVADFAITAFGPCGNRLNSHPESGQPINGRVIPGFKELAEACCEAARAVPGLRLMHWDVALTENGPVILELNDLGLNTFLQATGRGLFREPLCRALRQFADADANPWMSELPD